MHVVGSAGCNVEGHFRVGLGCAGIRGENVVRGQIAAAVDFIGVIGGHDDIVTHLNVDSLISYAVGLLLLDGYTGLVCGV